MTSQAILDAVHAYARAAGRARAEGRGNHADDQILREARDRLDAELADRGAPTGARPRAGAAGPFGRVIVPTEGGRQAAWAATVAGRLAAAVPGCRLMLLHVMERPVESYYGHGGFEDSDALRRELIGRGQAILNEQVDRLGSAVQAERRIVEGNPAAEITAVAHEWAADLIVMGAHARSRLAAFVFGSTTEGVIRRARCPVLVIAHDPSPASEVPPAVAARPHAGFDDAPDPAPALVAHAQTKENP